MTGWSLPWAWLLLLPWALVCWRLWRRPRRVAGLLFAPLSRLPADHRSWRHVMLGLLPWLWAAGLWLLVVAAAGPQTRWTQTRHSAEALAIQMVVDLSGSMDGLDLSPQPLQRETLQTRLDVVKTVFADFIRRRPDDLIGLTTFGGYATTRSPLTPDHDALQRLLAEVDIPRGRAAQDPEILMTAIGDALASACARIRDSEARSRIVILLSDGESNAGLLDPRRAAAIAAELGIRVYVIGIGTDEQVPYLARDAFGRDTLAYEPVTYDDALMAHIAEHTGGVYFNVRDTEGLEQALAAIDKLETTRIDRDVYTFANPHFLPFAAVGTLLVTLGTITGVCLMRRIA